jgi:hypothetical protein
MAVFSLQEVKKLQVQNVIDNNFASWPEGATYGYIAAGQLPPGRISTVHRLDFATDNIQALNPANAITSTLTDGATVKTSSYGYIGGGFTPPYSDVIRRYDFSTLTASNPGNDLPVTTVNNMSLQTRSYGYFCGGESPAIISSIFKLDFSNETISNPGNYIPPGAGNTGGSGLQSSEDASDGYLAGGYAPLNAPNFDEVARFNFSTETVSDTGADLVLDRSLSASFSSLSTGYQAGSSIPLSSAILKWSFETETSSSLPGILPTSLQRASGVASNENGYVVGGINPAPARVSSVHKLNFSTDTLTSSITMPPGTLISQSSSFSGGQSVARGNGYRTYGYWAGGATGTSDPTIISSIARQDFSTDAISIISSTLQGGPSGHPKSELGSIQSKNYGYFVGGDGAGTPGTNYGNSSHMTRLDFSNETTRFYPTWHPIGARDIAGTQSAHYGYSAGGYSLMPSAVRGFGPYWLSTIHRVDFDTETTTSPSNLRLPVRMSNGAAVESSDNAYFGGGYTGPGAVTDQVRKLNFATDTESTSPMTLTGQIYAFAGASDNNYGFFGAGYHQYVGNRSQVDRLDFSTETLTPNHTNLSLKKTAHSAVSDTRLYGYYGGGGDDSTITCTISRLDFSTGTSNTQSPNFPTIKYKTPGAVTN